MCMRLIRHRDYVIKISRMRSARPDPVCLQSATRVGWLTDTVVTVRELARWLIFFYGFFPVSPPPPTLSVCRPTVGSNYAGSKTELLLTAAIIR